MITTSTGTSIPINGSMSAANTGSVTGGTSGLNNNGGGGNGGPGAETPSPAPNSEVFLIFGQPGKGNNTIGYASGSGSCGNGGMNSGGMGTVVGNRSTIVTASHVVEDCAATQDTVWVQVNGEWVTYALSNVNVVPGQGDVVTLTLPSDLPGNVVPASMITNHHVVSGELVTVTDYKQVYNKEGKLTGFTAFSIVTTVKQNWRAGARNPAYGQQVMLSTTLQPGSSGGGVFYNGQLIGVNSYADNVNYTGTTMAPFCYTFGIVC